jgi:hypothetical protein
MEPPLTEAEIGELRELLRDRRRHAPHLLEREIGAMAQRIAERHERALHDGARGREEGS